MKKNVTTIKITFIKDHGRNHNWFCDNILMLRTARNVGDTENINNTVLSNLRRWTSNVSFEIIK